MDKKRKSARFFRENRKTVFFIMTGLSAAAVNLGLMVLLVEAAGFGTPFLRNLANFLSIEASIIFSFFLNRGWTWRKIPRRTGSKLAIQLLFFNLASLFSLCLRLVLFVLLDRAGVNYLLNSALGIGAAALLNFFFYDRLVFPVPPVREQDETFGFRTGHSGSNEL